VKPTTRRRRIAAGLVTGVSVSTLHAYSRDRPNGILRMNMVNFAAIATSSARKRYRLMRIVVAALFYLVPAIGAADTVSVGGVTVVIPAPEGFAAVTHDMAALYEYQEQLVAPGSEELAAFIPEGDVPAALRGRIPDLSRRFSAQTSKKNLTAIASTADFANLKVFAKSQNEELTKTVERSLPGLTADRNASITKKFGAEFAVSPLGMMPLAFHDESDRTLAWSAFVKGTTNYPDGKTTLYVNVVTTTLVLLNGKVLHLYCFGDQGDLEWSREASKRWANAIIAANPRTLDSRVKEPVPLARKPFNWEDMALNGVQGALIALALGWMVTKTRRKAS